MNQETPHAHSDRILIVDDSPTNLQFLTSLLREQGYTVHPASDGELALEFVRSVLPGLILLDIRMPGMGGFEVCRRLKANERIRSIPIIFISILEDERDKVKGLREGAVDYITKPFQPEVVLARVRIHLRLRELTERLEQKVVERTRELNSPGSQLYLGYLSFSHTPTTDHTAKIFSWKAVYMSGPWKSVGNLYKNVRNCNG